MHELHKIATLNMQGDIIKAGQTIGFLDQFSSEVPVKVSF